MNRNPREGLWRIDAAGLAVCLIIGAAAYLLGFGPLLADRALVLGHRQALADQTVEASKLDDEVKKAQDTRDKLQKQVAQIRPLDPPSRVNQRVKDLTDIAAGCGLKVGEIGPGAPAAGTRFTTVPIRLKGIGEYRTIAEFFARVHERFRDTAIVGFRASCNIESDKPDAEFSFDLEWYAAPAGSAGIADASPPQQP